MSKSKLNFWGKRKNFVFLTYSFFVITLLGIIAISIGMKSTLQTRSKAEDASPSPSDCASDPGRMDYCGENAPFRGCNVLPVEWICQCRLPSGTWWSECSIMEDTEGKQKYRDKCGGDEQKAFSQWKYDIALAETGGQCSCGGQNICGSLLPVRPTFPPAKSPVFPPGENPDIPPPQSPLPILTDIPTPTLTYQVPTQPSEQKIYYIPPTIPPFIPPVIEVKPTSAPVQLPKPSLNINFDFKALNNFLESTKINLMKFFSQVLP